MENEIRLIINKNKNDLIAIREDIEKERVNVYRNNNIDVILKLASQNENADELNKNLKDIREVNGGHDGYKNLIEQLV